MNLKVFGDLLEQKKLLVHIKKEVDVKFEVPTVMKMLDGKPLLFENVKGYDMPVVASICSTRELVALGLGVEQDQIIPTMISAIDSPKEPVFKSEPPPNYNKLGPNLDKIPILTYYPFDGGPYIASGIVIAEDPELGLNASYHRMMKIDNNTITMRILQRDFNKYLERGLTKFAIVIGNTIPLLLGAAISKSPDTNELAIANALRETPLFEVDGFKVPEAEIIMTAELVPGEEHDEGPSAQLDFLLEHFYFLPDETDIEDEEFAERIKTAIKAIVAGVQRLDEKGRAMAPETTVLSGTHKGKFYEMGTKVDIRK